jgi:hypothetical protein
LTCRLARGLLSKTYRSAGSGGIVADAGMRDRHFGPAVTFVVAPVPIKPEAGVMKALIEI